jgi:hypothetical protein
MRGHLLRRVRVAGRRPGRGEQRPQGRGVVALVVSIVCGVCGAGASSALAQGTPFQRGDLFLTGNGSLQEFSPSGQLQQTIPGTSGTTALCFDPSGDHLILPGVGLFDASGRLLPSNWRSVTNGSRCVADGFGHVYVSAGARGFVSYSITKYDITGNLLQAFDITDPENHVLAIDLAPDECTIYYGSSGAAAGTIRRLNVCTNTQGPPFNSDNFVDDLRVLPNWQVLVTDDPYARLEDASGQVIQTYNPSASDLGVDLRTMGLDPSGTSFWVCCTWVPPTPTVSQAFRFDVASGHLLTNWSPNSGGGGGVRFSPIAAYGPPLFGDANVESTIDAGPAGTAEAFSAPARYSGQMTRLHLFVDSSSTAGDAVVGIYSDRNGHPGELRGQGTITNVIPGSWNYIDLTSMSVSPGRRYWIAVLGPRGGGTLRFRHAMGGARSEASARSNLTALPAHWSRAARRPGAGPLSAYGS